MSETPCQKLRDFGNGYLCFWCPGCKRPHPYQVPLWTWNGSMDEPTFTPSLLVHAGESTPRCHLFLTDGRIHYCDDCGHELRGQVVDCPDWPWPYEEEAQP